MARRLTIFRHFDFSGGLQTSTSRLMRRTSELSAVRNVAFNVLIGALARRSGQTLLGTVQSGKDGLGSFVHRYSTGSRLYAATNNSGDTATVLKYWTGSAFSTLSGTSYAAGTRLSAVNYLDELYVAGYSSSTDTFATTSSIDSSPAISTTRNVLNAPRAKFISEYNGRLYASNVEVNVNGTWIRYPDRSYVSSPAMGAITFVQGDQSGTLTSIKVDSTRYLKTGMTVDIYQAGTETTRVTGLSITGVSKNANSYTISFASGSYTFTDNDEIWLAGRKNKLSVLWNTDFPTPETSDYLRIAPGQDENSAITAVGKINNRKFFFTSNSFSKWDGQNLIPVSSTIGCPAPESVKQVGSWLIWFHPSGIWGYNDSTGQLKLLSRAISDWVQAIPVANYPLISAGTFYNQYKLAVGSIPTYQGQAYNQNVRLVYDFDMNNWGVDTYARIHRYQYQFTVGTSVMPVFQDDQGNIIVGNSGNTDLDTSLNPVAIPLEAETGRNNLGWDEKKNFNHVFAYAKQGRQAELMYQIDGGDWHSLGEVQTGIQKFVFPVPNEGYDINYRIVQSDTGDPLILEGLSTHYSMTELTYA